MVLIIIINHMISWVKTVYNDMFWLFFLQNLLSNVQLRLRKVEQKFNHESITQFEGRELICFDFSSSKMCCPVHRGSCSKWSKGSTMRTSHSLREESWGEVKDRPRIEVDLRVQNLVMYLKIYLVIFVFRTLKSFPGCISLTSRYDLAKSVN